MEKKYSRKQYFINKDLQLRIMRDVFFTVLVLTFVLSLSIYYVVNSRLTKSVELGKNSIENIDAGRGTSAVTRVKHMAKDTRIIDVTKDNMYVDIIKIFVLNIVFSLLVVVFSFMFISHRIAGPVYRFSKAFDALREGDLSVTVNLRKKDELKDLADKFNVMMLDMNDKMLAVTAASQGVKKAVGKSKAAAKCKALDEAIGQFKTVQR
ncbi:MAG: HAMP domain-containing protein [Spirochaetes bacterium]|nr:HAMP domain-containing protein [Spirochaetota bacterium]